MGGNIDLDTIYQLLYQTSMISTETWMRMVAMANTPPVEVTIKMNTDSLSPSDVTMMVSFLDDLSKARFYSHLNNDGMTLDKAYALRKKAGDVD